MTYDLPRYLKGIAELLLDGLVYDRVVDDTSSSGCDTTVWSTMHRVRDVIRLLVNRTCDCSYVYLELMCGCPQGGVVIDSYVPVVA